MAPLEYGDAASATWECAGNQAPDALMRAFLYVARHCGHPVGEADVRSRAPATANVLDEAGFLAAARRFGLEAYAVDGAVGGLPMPFTLLASDGTARVVVGRRGGRWQVLDVMQANLQQLSDGELSAIGRRALVMARPRPAARDAPWFAPLASLFRPALGWLAAASFAINLLGLATPIFMMVVVNHVVGPAGTAEPAVTMLLLAAGMLAIYAFDFGLRVVRGWLSTRSAARLDVALGAEVLHHLLHLPYPHFQQTASGMIVERLRQLDVLRAFLTSHMPVLVMDLAFVALFLAATLAIDLTLGSVALLAVPVIVAAALCTHRSQRRLAERNFQALAAKSSALVETVANAATIKALGLEPEVERAWRERAEEAAWTSFRAGHLANLSASASGALQLVALLAIAILGVQAVLDHRLSLGGFVAANLLAARALQPMRQLVAAWNQVQAAGAALRRIDALMAERSEADDVDLAPLPTLSGEIVAERVSLHPAGLPAGILHDVDLSVQAGEILGLVGPSGSGKTTLANLLQGLVHPTAGRVLMDGMDIAHLSPAQLRTQIGCVPQDLHLFAGSVRENIALGVADKDPARVVAVARFVGAHDFIQRLPRGYATMLGERGQGLSMGQRQLICIARALIRNPRLLILDEATSALDPAAEEQLLRQLKASTRGRTVIMITHRLAPLAIADRVALLVDGRLERVGAPTDVMAYARLRMAEAARGAVPPA